MEIHIQTKVNEGLPNEEDCCWIIAGGTILDTYTILSSGIGAAIRAIREGDGISAGSLDWRNENNNALQVCYYMYIYMYIVQRGHNQGGSILP